MSEKILVKKFVKNFMKKVGSPIMILNGKKCMSGKNFGCKKKAGAELGQAQHKLGFDSALILYIFGFYRSSQKIEKKIIHWSPLWIIFKGKIKIAQLWPE